MPPLSKLEMDALMGDLLEFRQRTPGIVTAIPEITEVGVSMYPDGSMVLTMIERGAAAIYRIPPHIVPWVVASRLGAYEEQQGVIGT